MGTLARPHVKSKAAMMDRKTMMLAMSAMAFGQLMQQPMPVLSRISPLEMRDRKMITKAERAKRNKVKSIAKQSRNRNRR